MALIEDFKLVEINDDIDLENLIRINQIRATDTD